MEATLDARCLLFPNMCTKPRNHTSTNPFSFMAFIALQHLASFLEKSSPDIVGGIAHLFVSNDHGVSNLEIPEPTRSTSLATSLRRHVSSKMSGLVPGGKRRQRRQRLAETEADLSRDGANVVAIIRVLKAVAPTLRTLTICFTSRSCTLPFSSPNAHFPASPFYLSSLSVIELR